MVQHLPSTSRLANLADFGGDAVYDYVLSHHHSSSYVPDNTGNARDCYRFSKDLIR